MSIIFTDCAVIGALSLTEFLHCCECRCGLLKLRSFRESASTLGCFLPPPRTAPEEHERRMTFWCAYILEAAYVGNGNYYESNINDFGVTTSLPSSVADFQAGREPADNPQTLSSDDLFENGHVDDFNLHVKAMVLLKRVKWVLSRNDCYTDGDESRSETSGIPRAGCKHCPISDVFTSARGSKSHGPHVCKAFGACCSSEAARALRRDQGPELILIQASRVHGAGNVSRLP